MDIPKQVQDRLKESKLLLPYNIEEIIKDLEHTDKKLDRHYLKNHNIHFEYYNEIRNEVVKVITPCTDGNGGGCGIWTDKKSLVNDQCIKCAMDDYDITDDPCGDRDSPLIEGYLEDPTL
jgi:hypothetical protein